MKIGKRIHITGHFGKVDLDTYYSEVVMQKKKLRIIEERLRIRISNRLHIGIHDSIYDKLHIPIYHDFAI